MFDPSSIILTVEVLQTLLDSLPNPVFLIDRDHRLVLINQAMADFVGYEREAILGRSSEGRVPPELLEGYWRIDDRVFATGESDETEEIVTGAGGQRRIVITRKRLIQLDTVAGPTKFIIAVLSDVTRFREAEARARHLAAHDGLTGLPNRGQFTRRLAEALAAAQRSGELVAVLLVDLDGFKPINDRFGHIVGDSVLRIIGRRLGGVIRAGDTVARLGGDEFCVIQRGISQEDHALNLAGRIVAAIGQPLAAQPEPLAVTASVGLSLCPFDGDDPDILLERADRALYAVKHAGRGGFSRYHAGLHRPLAPPDMPVLLRDLPAEPPPLAAGEIS
ncbi:MAG: diguanylate cyclase [Acidiphilium sp. 37-67-22]|nr:MAG: diguanylate cyclase [Acidiphilium sp. 37-67-22]HQT73809.1 GGDEF domain-containing protein [Acidiphilium sp.]